MTRKKLDLIFSIGGVLLALLLLVLGLVLRNQSTFAKSYVRDQMSAQQISFNLSGNSHRVPNQRQTIAKTLPVFAFNASSHRKSPEDPSCEGLIIIPGQSNKCSHGPDRAMS